MKTAQDIPPIQEAMIVGGLNRCLNLMVYISEDPRDKKAHIFIEHFILSLRELGFYIEKFFYNNLTNSHQNQIGKIKNIRNAICHRSSHQNLLHAHLYLSGSLNFKNDDIEIQYGNTTILLKDGMVELYIDFRRIISNSTYFAFMRGNPAWNVEEQKFQETLKRLTDALNTKKISQKIRENI